MKICESTDNGRTMHSYRCPACGRAHIIPVTTDPSEAGQYWLWNGDKERPTYTPSIVIRDWRSGTCHAWIRDGHAEFLSDCTHALMGQTVEIPEWGRDTRTGLTMTEPNDFYIESPPWGTPHVFRVGTQAYRHGDVGEIHRDFCRDLYDLKTLRHLRPMQVIMDFGAGIGAFAVAAHQVWPEAEIYCFEPDARKYELLCDNIRLGGDGWRNVHAFGNGVGYAPELMDIEEVFAQTSEEFVDLARWSTPAMEACFPHIHTHSAERIDMMTGHYRSTFDTFERLAQLAFPLHTFLRPHASGAGRFTGVMRGH